jgi:ABC-type oligopeptide transport system ATPase subunit
MVETVELEKWCLDGVLPTQEAFFSAIIDEDGRFSDIEGQYWDFKESWPFSYSDENFCGICRLICAFSNSAGGSIVFGVNDKTREGGKNIVRPNLDKLLMSFEQLTGRRFDFDFKSYPGTESIGAIQVLLIKPRPRNSKPVVFIKKQSGYAAGIIWVRSGHEVTKAEPQHYANLFLSNKRDSVEGSIPPSTAQIKRFIGRVEAMSELFDWLQNSDEPRTYLYGKGGSGKTTIAREFARLIRSFGSGVEIEGGDNIDLVLFLSAKEKELLTADAQVVELNEPDFFDEESLLKKIILLSGGIADDTESSSENLRQYRQIVVEYFESFSYLIVIDDIDTLTTKGIDPGADFLYRALSRAKRRSKILYTTRNAPSQSIHNSIEVPGLNDDDYLDFVEECVARFNTPKPSNEFRDNRLPKLSERRPLVIEAIVALARSAGGYDGAERLFLQNTGDNIRDYVFAREWDSLPNGLERPLLAALADLNRPTSFEDLKIVLQSGDSTIRDAIGGVREMFLSVDDVGTQTLFALAPLTRSFVLSKRSSLKIYPAIKERVSNFKKTIKLTSPEVARILANVRRLLPLRLYSRTDHELKTAFALVRDPNLPARITEDPIFRAAKGYVEAVQIKPNLLSVRSDFRYAIQMRHEPEIEELMAWFNAEKESQSLGEDLFVIMDTVISGRRYSEEEKIGMLSRKGTTTYVLARQKVYIDTEAALKMFRESLLLHLITCKLNAQSGSPMLDTSEKYARNTAQQWLQIIFEGNKWEVLIALLDLERECEGYLDPIAEPFMSYFRKLLRSAWFPSEKARINSEARRLQLSIASSKKWMDPSVLSRVLSEINLVAEATRIR